MILALAVALAIASPRHQAQTDQTRKTAIENPEKLRELLLSDAQNEVPPFGAESVRMAREAGPAATPLLLAEIRLDGVSSFLALEALRAADEDSWGSLPGDIRAHIYAEALRRNVFFNAWGLPGHKLTGTSSAFASLGPAAVSVLQPLLSDPREAPLSGSQDATTSTMYGNRIRDYAWILICNALGRPCAYDLDPKQRDIAIAAMQHELDSAARPR